MGKVRDYVLCPACNKLNHYENAIVDSAKILEYIENDYAFYMKEERCKIMMRGVECYDA